MNQRLRSCNHQTQDSFSQGTNFKVPAKTAHESERAAALADLEAHNGDDAAECAAADLFREFPPIP
jgi:hypothetical protein